MSSYDSGDPEKGEAGLIHLHPDKEHQVDPSRDSRTLTVDTDSKVDRRPSTAQTCTDSSTTSTKPLRT